MEQTLTTIMIIFILITFFLTLFVAWKSYANKNKLSTQEINYINKAWHKINSEVNHNPKQAILDADKILDHILKKKGYKGSLGEKMKKARNLFQDNNSVWAAHKIRNRIAHEIDFEISSKLAKKTLKQFKKAYSDLGIKL